jgi:type I restriction enzyme S subunit
MLVLNNEGFWIRSGGAQPFVKVSETLSRPIALPPLAEQHRIVARVGELMALCDQLKSGICEVRGLNQQLASTLVQQAIT